MTCILIAERKSDALVLMNVGLGKQLFAVRALRKDRECAACGRKLVQGAAAYGEVTSSAMNRRLRFCEPCVAAAAGLTIPA